MITCAFSWIQCCTFWEFFNLETQNAEGLAECVLEQLSVILNGNREKITT
jgi:hypothetical protein